MFGNSFTPREKKLALFLVVVLFLLGFALKKEKSSGSLEGQEEKFQALDLDTSQEKPLVETPGTLYVHVTGAVKKPGLYEFSDPVRVMDVIESAGGFTETADPDQLNLAAKVEDEARIHVPEKGPKEEGENQKSLVKDRVNINQASLQDLLGIPGVGEKTAQKIIDYREKSPFQKPEDLKEVPGIGERKYEEMKDYLSVY